MTTSAAPRCPHVVVDGVLGSAGVAALLDHVAGTRAAFVPGGAWNRVTGAARIDLGRRDCLVSRDLGACRGPFAERLGEIAAEALPALRIDERNLGPFELELSSYGDGGHFKPHIDTLEDTRRVRMLSCVYYFAATPRRFTGGALRLHAFPASAEVTEVAMTDVEAETDRLVAFPSWMRHEVTPVRLASDDWRDRRFAVNAWIHRDVDR